MGATSSLPLGDTHECHDLPSRRRNNRAAFAASVASLRTDDLPTTAAPHRPAAGAERPRICLRKRPLFETERAADFDVISCASGGDGHAVWGDGPASSAWVTRGMLCADARTMYAEHHAFYADAVFDEEQSSADVYAAAVRPLVDAAFGAQPSASTVMCFGQTGSGKTFTVHGILDCLSGELPAGPWRVSALEVAGQAVTDLLRGGAPCVLRSDASGAVHVLPERQKTQPAGSEAGAAAPVSTSTSVVVEDAAAALAEVLRAARLRSTHATGVHDASSRTHALYTLSPATDEGGAAGGGEGGAASGGAGGLGRGSLTLVDLAGSEWSRDQASHEKERRKEAQEVNKSLSTLKACLAAREGFAQAAQAGKTAPAGSRMPIRDSALTRVLKSALEGSGRMVLIGTVSPASSDAEHAIDTLHHCALRVSPSGAVVVAAGAGDGGTPSGARVLTRRVEGIARLDIERGGADGGAADGADGSAGAAEARPPPRALPADPRQWTPAEVVAWWIDTSSAAVAAINGSPDSSVGATLIRVCLDAGSWPPRTKLGLTFDAAAPDAADAPPVVSRLAPRTPLSQASPLLRAGCTLLGCILEHAARAADADAADADAADDADAAAPPVKDRASILADLKRCATALVAAADGLDAAKTEARRAAEGVKKRLDPDAQILRESRLGQGDGAALVAAFADPAENKGLNGLIAACDGDTRVAGALYGALVGLAHP